ncbi:hypothetical protein KDA_66660 [Dictyobacter alpinus]|uniref:Uncharacterized protein n=2 Tax=Dictyobacter alpinus TaxID=2014873 RepID=A0A402BIX6_9CHLR|nr:hypothetical protein KDA_66660 [Dictyobacter alpinus]
MATIETIFIDNSTGQVFGKAEMPVENLPQSFALDTTMHIGDEDWTVANAEPMTAEEFMRTGKLVLTLQKVVKVPAKDILFTLPTLCDEIPPVLAGSTKQGKHICELHEDDWRQIEFISIAQQDAIDDEFTKIRDIYQKFSVSNGQFFVFKHIHVRQPIDVLLPEGILLDQLTDFFAPMLSRYDGIAYQGSDGLIEGGFAFSVATHLFYGQHVDGMVKMLGIKVGASVPTKKEDIVYALQHFMTTYRLYLVDWCSLQIIPADAEMISTFLED